MTRHLKLKAAIYVALCATSLTLLAGNGCAAESGDAPRRVVKFADLDLTQSAGISALYARIQSAAHEVCEPVAMRDLKAEASARACAAHAVERAIADVNVAQLTSYHLAKVGRRSAVMLAQRS